MVEQKERQLLFERDIMPRYQSSIDWLQTFITDVTGKRYFEPKTQAEMLAEYKRQLIRTTAFLDYLGNPQDQYPSIHIAGTGGKGSTAIILGKALEAHSPRVGVHTSPYLQVPGEKLLVNSKIIAPSKYADAVAQLRIAYERFHSLHPEIDLHYVEMRVALFHLYFAQSDLSWGVIETGMGGRFDPTNVLKPRLSVITNIDFDHVPQLGTTIREIAWHKAGIIKPGIPIITAEQKPEALAAIVEEADKQGSRLYQYPDDFSFEIVSSSTEGLVLNINGPNNVYNNIPIPLVGLFQAQNACLAISAADILTGNSNVRFTEADLSKSFENLNFPGRMEVIQQHPTVILDGAHNPQKIAALAESIKRLYPDREFTLIIGMLGMKDISASLPYLLARAKRVVTTKPNVKGKPGADASKLAQIIKDLGYKREITVQENVEQAISKALEEANPDDIILITGSLYMLGEARNHWVKPEDILFNSEFQNYDK